MLETKKRHVLGHLAPMRVERPAGSETPSERPDRSCSTDRDDDHLLSPGASSVSSLLFCHVLNRGNVFSEVGCSCLLVLLVLLGSLEGHLFI